MINTSLGTQTTIWVIESRHMVLLRLRLLLPCATCRVGICGWNWQLFSDHKLFIMRWPYAAHYWVGNFNLSMTSSLLIYWLSTSVVHLLVMNALLITKADFSNSNISTYFSENCLSTKYRSFYNQWNQKLANFYEILIFLPRHWHMMTKSFQPIKSEVGFIFYHAAVKIPFRNWRFLSNRNQDCEVMVKPALDGRFLKITPAFFFSSTIVHA